MKILRQVLWYLGSRKRQLDRIEDFVAAINRKVNYMSPQLQRITDEVREARATMTSAKTLIEKLAQQIRDNADDPEALRALADELDQSGNELAKAVTDNTPAENEGGDGTPV